MNLETKELTLADFEIKTDGDAKGTFTGYGSTFGGVPDSYGDIIVAGAFSETITKGGRNGNGIAMLAYHDSHRPIGQWTELSQDAKGLKVTGQLAMGARDAEDMFYLMKGKAIKSLSIGFSPKEVEFDEKKKVRYIKAAELWEISPVVFPANTKATITQVKSIIENAKDEKEFEAGLREAGVSKDAAIYLCSLFKMTILGKRAESEKGVKLQKGLESLLAELKNLRLGSGSPAAKI